MSEPTPGRRPLFPPRPEEPFIPPTPSAQQDVATTTAPPPPPEPPAFNVALAAQIERTIVEMFVKRYGPIAMGYGQARDLVLLERDLVGTLVNMLAKPQPPRT